MLTTEQFDWTRRLALRLAGIELHERHRDLIHRRCRRDPALGPGGLDALLRAADGEDPVAKQRLLGLITTRFTGFFRHPEQVAAAARHAVRAVQLRGHARLWSAAAATGEEPYSLAMALADAFPGDNPPVTIVGTDISEEAIATAQAGEYGGAALAELDPELRCRHFTKLAGGTRWLLAPGARCLVELRTLNLVDSAWPEARPFDVIFCRNVLMYMEKTCRQSVLERLASLLMADGLLTLDPAEHLGPADTLFSQGPGGTYLRKPTLNSPQGDA